MSDPPELELQMVMEHLLGCWETHVDPLEEQQVLLPISNLSPDLKDEVYRLVIIVAPCKGKRQWVADNERKLSVRCAILRTAV